MIKFLKLIFFGVSDAPSMVLQSPNAKNQVKVQYGFSFSLLVLSTFFGLPLLRRRLYGFAFVMFTLSSVQIWRLVERMKAMLNAITLAELEALQQTDFIDDAAGYFLLAMSVILAFKGNEWTVKNLLKKGWRFTDPEQPIVKKAVANWHISKHYLKRKAETL